MEYWVKVSPLNTLTLGYLNDICRGLLNNKYYAVRSVESSESSNKRFVKQLYPSSNSNIFSILV